MERARYKYMELTSEDPQAFGKQLTRALSDLRAQGSEIVNVSMDLVPAGESKSSGTGQMLRVAQILILEPARGTKTVKTTDTVMH